jgi:hypothetical protein
MLGERYALGAKLGAVDGAGIGPATACRSARGDQDARSPLCAGAGLGGPVHARSARRCRPEPSQHCPRLRQRLRSGHALSGHGVRGSAIRGGRTNIEVSLEYRLAARPASWSPSSSRTRTSRSNGRSTASARSWSAAASSWADRAYRTCGPGSCEGRRPSQPVTRAVHPADRSQGWMARTRMASVAGGPGGGGGGRVVGPARRRVPGPRRAAAVAA